MRLRPRTTAIHHHAPVLANHHTGAPSGGDRGGAGALQDSERYEKIIREAPKNALDIAKAESLGVPKLARMHLRRLLSLPPPIATEAAYLLGWSYVRSSDQAPGGYSDRYNAKAIEQLRRAEAYPDSNRAPVAMAMESLIERICQHQFGYGALAWVNRGRQTPGPCNRSEPWVYQQLVELYARNFAFTNEVPEPSMLRWVLEGYSCKDRAVLTTIAAGLAQCRATESHPAFRAIAECKALVEKQLNAISHSQS